MSSLLGGSGGGIGTIAAVVVALWVVKHDSNRARRAEESQRAARASAVFSTFKAEDSQTYIDGKPRMGKIGIQVEDHGSLPIIMVHIRSAVVLDPRSVDRSGSRAGQARHLQVPAQIIDVLPAGETAFFELEDVDPASGTNF